MKIVTEGNLRPNEMLCGDCEICGCSIEVNRSEAIPPDFKECQCPTVGCTAYIRVKTKADWAISRRSSHRDFTGRQVSSLKEITAALVQELGSINKLLRHETEGNGVDICMEVYKWPEFQAFAKRLGIAVNLGTVALSIHFPAPHKPVRIVHEYIKRQGDTNEPQSI